MSTYQDILLAILRGAKDTLVPDKAPEQSVVPPNRDFSAPEGGPYEPPMRMSAVEAQDQMHQQNVQDWLGGRIERANMGEAERIAYAAGEAIPPTAAFAPLAASGGGLTALLGELVAGPGGAAVGGMASPAA